MLDVLMATEDFKILYCAPTSDMLQGNSLSLIKKLGKATQARNDKSTVLDNLLLMSSPVAQNLHEDTFRLFQDHLVENKALKHFMESFEEKGSSFFHMDFTRAVKLIKQCQAIERLLQIVSESDRSHTASGDSDNEQLDTETSAVLLSNSAMVHSALIKVFTTLL